MVRILSLEEDTQSNSRIVDDGHIENPGLCTKSGASDSICVTVQCMCVNSLVPTASDRRKQDMQYRSSKAPQCKLCPRNLKKTCAGQIAKI